MDRRTATRGNVAGANPGEKYRGVRGSATSVPLLLPEARAVDPHRKPPPRGAAHLLRALLPELALLLALSINAAVDLNPGTSFLKLGLGAHAALAAVVFSIDAMARDIAPHICMVSASIFLTLTGVITPSEGLTGFSNDKVAVIGVLFVVAKGVTEAGALPVLIKSVLGKPRAAWNAQLRMMVPVTCMSAVLNNTPVVMIMVDIVAEWAPVIGVNPKRLFLPLSYASIFGGTWTKIGSSSNLIVLSLAAQAVPDFHMGFFELSVVGIPAAVVGTVYMMVVSRIMFPTTMPDSAKGSSDADTGARTGGDGRELEAGVAVTGSVNGGSHLASDTGAGRVHGGALDHEHCVDFEILPGCPVIGMDAQDAALSLSTVCALSSHARPGRRGGFDVEEFSGSNDNDDEFDGGSDRGVPRTTRKLGGDEFRNVYAVGGAMGRRGRAGTDSASANGSENGWAGGGGGMVDFSGASVAAGDVLSFSGPLSGINQLRRARGLGSAVDEMRQFAGRRRRRCLVEAVLGRESPLVGRTVREVEFGDRFNCAILSIKHLGEGGATSGRYVADLRFESGDALLIEAYNNFRELWNGTPHFALISVVDNSTPTRKGTRMDQFRAVLSIVTVLAMIIVAAVGVAELYVTATVAAAIFILSKTITVKDALRSINVEVLLTIASAFALGVAMENTGVSQRFAELIADAAKPGGALALLFGVYAITMALSSVISPNATLIVMFSVVRRIADEAGLGLKQFVVVLMCAASICLSSPISYQTNLICMHMGEYRFSDFVKAGWPLQIILMFVNVLLAHAFFGHS